MDADWYEDPLGRFDGRFFDGTNWTERVSTDGRLEIDAEFLQAKAPFAGSSAPAVEAVPKQSATHASMLSESPVRVVAVLDEPVVRSEAAKARSGFSIKSLALVAALIAVIGLLAIVGYQLLSKDDALDAEQEDRVADLQAGSIQSTDTEDLTELEAAPAPEVATSDDFDADQAIDVGGSTLLNGVAVLSDLQEWHKEFASERGVELTDEASCWFGHLGGSAVQAVHCGPVGGDADTEFLFDLVPLIFEDTDNGQLVEAVTDGVTIDAVLANTLTLVGSEEHPPPLSLEGATRGDRGDD